jgi:hypothetical protein
MTLLRIAGALFWLGLCQFLSGCEDCPNCPEQPNTESNYSVYLMGLTSSTYDEYMYVYNTSCKGIIDSLLFTDLGVLDDMAISADGENLILLTESDSDNESTLAEYYVTIYDVPGLDTVASYPIAGREIEVSNTGEYIAIYGRDSIVFLDGTTYQILFTDTGYVHGGRFLQDDSKFYVIHQYKRIRIYDMKSQSLDTIIEYQDNDGYSPSLYIVQPNTDGSKLYLSSAYNSVAGFVLAYIPLLDSTVLHYPYTRGASDLRLTPDGSQIIFTDPGQIAFGVYGSAHVVFFNPDTDAIISIVAAGQSMGGQVPTGFYPGEIVVTPDNRYTITASCGYPVFGMIDNTAHKYVDIENHQESQKSFINVSCSKY